MVTGFLVIIIKDMERIVLSRYDIESRLILVRDQMVLLDCDVADLYGVQTKHVNQAVRNNPDKFPEGYVFELNDDEMRQVKIFDLSARSHYNSKAFTEKGLYMLATILKSPLATKTSIAIIEAYARLKEFGRTVAVAGAEKDEDKQKHLLHRVGELMSDLVSDSMEITEDEYTMELNLMAVRLSRKVKRQKKNNKLQKNL